MKTSFAVALVGAALITLPAVAQTTAPATTPPATTAQRQADTGALYQMKPGQWRATKLTGLAVYNNNNERIGDVNELIVGRDGKVEAVVIGVGGFLGIGEHLAAVPFSKVQWVDEARTQTVGQRTTTTTTTTGSGASVPSAGSTAAPGATMMDRPATTNTTDRPATAMDRPATTTTTGPATTTTTERPATAMDRPATTTTTERPATTTAMRSAYRGYPDHLVVNMTKDQVKALPQVRYAQ